MKIHLLLITLCLANFVSAAARKPNFIYLFTDDQRGDALGVVQSEQGEKGRFPWLKTPNLDRLAGEGLRFRNAFVVNSLCAPSRASLITGQYGHVNGIVNNHTPHPAGKPNLATLLRPAGYVSGYFGKWHHGNQSGQRPGFDYSASFVGQGVYFDCPIEVNGLKTPSKGFVDDVTTDYATRFIREHKDQPFLMVLGFKTCHGPFTPPPREANAYEGALARPVPNLGLRPPYAVNRQEKPKNPAAAAVAKDGSGVPVNLGMFRGINSVDDNVGKVLKVLDELLLTEDTVVVFSSDNGYYMGEHGLGDKRSAYEESLRIPMIVRYPKLVAKGRTDDRIVLNIDPAPTFLDLASQPVPSEMQGCSWKPILEDKPAEAWRQSFFYCYFFEKGFPNTPTTTAVRTTDAKLIKYPGHDEWTEMFDLKADLYETRNLAADPAFADLRKKLEAEYEKQSAAITFRIPDFADVASDNPAAKPRNKGKVKGRRTNDQ